MAMLPYMDAHSAVPAPAANAVSVTLGAVAAAQRLRQSGSAWRLF